MQPMLTLIRRTPTLLRILYEYIRNRYEQRIVHAFLRERFGYHRKGSYIYGVNKEKIKVMLKKDVVKVREILMNEVDCKFTVKGITQYDRKKDGSYGQVAKVFRTSGSINKDGSVGAIYEENVLFGQGMNVTKWGPTCVTLFTYDMFGRKIVGKIRYADVRFVVSEEENYILDQLGEKNPLKTLPGFIGTEKG